MLHRLWRAFVAHWNAKFHPIQFGELPEPAKSVYKPTEVFPELVQWKIGDPIHEVMYYDGTWGTERRYEGVTEDGKVYISFLGDMESITISSLKRRNYINGRIEKAKIKGELSNNLMKDLGRFQELVAQEDKKRLTQGWK